VRAAGIIPAGGLIAGCAAGVMWPDTPSAVLLSFFAASIGGVAWSRHARRAAAFAWATAGVFFSGGALLAVDAWRDAWRPPLRVAFEERSEGEPVLLEGVLAADAALRESSVSLRVAVTRVWRAPFDARTEGTALAGGVQLTVAGALAAGRVGEWRAGRTIRAPTELRRPSRYLNPGVPDEERAMARRGITLVGSVKSGALVEVVATGRPAQELAAAVRAHVRDTVARTVGRYSDRSAAIVTAILIGDRAGLSAPLTRRLQEAGTYHVIAISGGNIAILAALTLALFRVTGTLGAAAMLTAAAGLLSYCYIVGAGASVMRATLMAVLYFGARAIDLRGPPVNALLMVAGVLVAVRPLAVADPGLLLTCGATAGILLCILRIGPALQRLPLLRLLWPAAALFAASLAAEAALLPATAALFSRITFAGLVVNFAAIPAMAVVQMAGLAILPADALAPTLSNALGWVAHAGADVLVRSSSFVELAPIATWRVAPPHWIAIAIYYASLAALWTSWPARPRLAWTARACFTAAALWILAEPWTLIAARPDGRLHVTFLDVGQGDATLVRFPTGESWLIDAGGLAASSTFDIGDRVVAPVIRRLGIRRLDTVAITHGDWDHLGGAQSIVEEFRPRDVWEGVPVPPLVPLRTLREAARGVRARWTTVQTHHSLAIGGVEVVVRHPPRPDWERQDVRNDDSIVLELLYGDASIVLTGDIGREVEAAIGAAFAPSPLRVVKVPHHGSRTSSSGEFVRALAPRIAVVSAGRGNPYGHPALDVLERYEEVGADVYRTDVDGAVTVSTDGKTLQVETFVEPRNYER
jgi:competence protein ComEC